MGFLIDSSVLVAADRGLLDLDRLLESQGDEAVALAAISASELLHGLHRLKGVRRARSEAFVERILAALPIVPFDLAAARVHAVLAADLRAKGTPVGPHDLLIAATAVLRGDAVATRDLRSFPRIHGLDVVTW
jgi:predicted nucleic acid-binding protein